MANYMGNSPSYSLLDDMEFRTAFSGQPQTQQQASAQQEGLLSPSTAQAAARGAQSGGLSGALMSGGISSLLTSGAAAGGPYAIAGGLLLSELEAAQRAKAEQEAQEIANEKNRRSNMQNVLQQNARTTFKV